MSTTELDILEMDGGNLDDRLFAPERPVRIRMKPIKFPTVEKGIRHSKNINNYKSKGKKLSGSPKNSDANPCQSLACKSESSNWNTFLSSPQNLKYVAPVTYFKHALLLDGWDEFSQSAIRLNIELPNPFVDAGDAKVYWVAMVQLFAGYKALVEFENFGRSTRYLAWISFCSPLPKPLGFSTRNRILLHPMLDVKEAFPNFIEKLEKILNSCNTIKDDHATMLKRKIRKSQKRFPIKSKVEALDRTYLSRVRMATVTAYIGDRMHVTYDHESIPNDQGFIFSVNSEYVHPIGWAMAVGHEIFDPIENLDPLSESYFPEYPKDIELEVGQVLEARHPYDPYVIASASIDTILKHGYFMASFKSTPKELKRPTRYCFHITSAYIYPVGFCERNGIALRKGEETSSMGLSAPLHLLPTRPTHQFSEQLKFEATDVNDPQYLGPVTVQKVAEHMLYIHFDSWPLEDPSNSAWISADSPDIYPLGYAELIGHKLQCDPVSKNQNN